MQELPQWIGEAIYETIEQFPWCSNPRLCKGQCLRISERLISNLITQNSKLRLFDTCKVVFKKAHFWVWVDGWQIDLTARQFDAKEDCPKIWKGSESGLLELQLQPFNKVNTRLSKLKRKVAQKLLK